MIVYGAPQMQFVDQGTKKLLAKIPVVVGSGSEAIRK